MSRTVEKWYPLCAGLVIGLVYGWWFPWRPESKALNALLPTIVSISAIAVGFIATAMSILVSMHGRRTIRSLRQMGTYDLLIRYMIGAVQWCLVLAVVSAVLLLTDLSSIERWLRWVLGAWVFLTIGTGLACFRIMSIFFAILRMDQQSEE